MMNFLEQNYEWIFSGIGVLVISAIYSFLIKKKKKRSGQINLQNVNIKDNADTNIQIANNLVNNNIVVQPASNPPIEAIIMYDKEPIEIIKTVDNTPPFQRNAVEASFSGLFVNWVVIFHDVLSKEGNIVTVMTNYKQQYPWIYFKVDIEKYPIFKVAREHEEFIITGRILKVSGHDIDLKIDSIKKKQNIVVDTSDNTAADANLQSEPYQNDQQQN